MCALTLRGFSGAFVECHVVSFGQLVASWLLRLDLGDGGCRRLCCGGLLASSVAAAAAASGDIHWWDEVLLDMAIEESRKRGQLVASRLLRLDLGDGGGRRLCCGGL